jgi:hypothetical protein
MIAAATWANEFWHLYRCDLSITIIYTHDFMHSPDLWHQPRLANVTCAWNWRFCGIIPVVHIVEKAGGGAEPVWTLLRRRQWTRRSSSYQPVSCSLHWPSYPGCNVCSRTCFVRFICTSTVPQFVAVRPLWWNCNGDDLSAVAVVTTEESGFDSMHWQESFIFSKTARPAGGPAQSPI